MGLKKAGYVTKKRNTSARKRKCIFVISTEGKNKTEKLYFKQLNNDKVRIHFSKGGSTDPVNMISELVGECERIDFDPSLGDKAYCVIDSDFLESKNQQLSIADKKANKDGIQVIVSGPCFEIWYLSHFAFSTKSYDSNEDVIQELRKYIPDYDKAKAEIYEELLPKQAYAVKNAKKLENFNYQNGKKPHTVEFMPSTEVYKIIEAFRETGNEKGS